MRLTAVVWLIVALTGCGGGGSGDSDTGVATAAQVPETSEGISASTESEVNSVDITDAIFDSRAVDCADYDNEYSSIVVDLNRSVGFNGAVTITAGTESCLLTSNVIPNHNFNDGAAFATQTSEQLLQVTIPRNPQLAAETTSLRHGRWDGVMLNGVVIGVLSAGCWNGTNNSPVGCQDTHEWLINPLTSDGFFGHDTHHAHTQPDGTYHYHGEPLAMYDDFPGPNGSPVIGFAADGFPIFGPYFFDESTGQVRKAISGYTLKTEPRDSITGPGGIPDGFYNNDWEWTDAGDLDKCNGMTTDGQYGYYVTETYPHTMRCLKGTANESFVNL